MMRQRNMMGEALEEAVVDRNAARAQIPIGEGQFRELLRSRDKIGVFLRGRRWTVL